MTKQDLLRKVVAEVEAMDTDITVTQKQVDVVLKVLPGIVMEVMRKDDKIMFPGLGTFSVKEVPERRGKILMGENAGEEYVKPAHREPKFKVTKALKNMFVE